MSSLTEDLASLNQAAGLPDSPMVCMDHLFLLASATHYI